MTHVQIYSDLYATTLNPEQHERTCGYWFTVTNGATSHVAFATRAGLDRWLNERGLALETDLPAAGAWGTTRIVGEYREALHGASLPDPGDGTWPGMVPDAEWDALVPMAATAQMSNGRYTLAFITEDSEGVRTVHTLNPNVKTRVEFDSKRTRAWLESAPGPVKTAEGGRGAVVWEGANTQVILTSFGFHARCTRCPWVTETVHGKYLARKAAEAHEEN